MSNFQQEGDKSKVKLLEEKYLSDYEKKKIFFVKIISDIIYVISYIIDKVQNELANAKMRKNPEFIQQIEESNKNANFRMEIAQSFIVGGNLLEAIQKGVLKELFYVDRIPKEHIRVLEEIIDECIDSVRNGKKPDDIISNIIIEKDGEYESTFDYLNNNRDTVCRMSDMTSNKDDIDKIIEKTVLSLKLSGVNIKQVNNHGKDDISNRNV